MNIKELLSKKTLRTESDEYEIKIVDEIAHNPNSAGVVIFADSLIEIKKGNDYGMLVTLLHEIIHSFLQDFKVDLFTGELKEFEELFTHAMGIKFARFLLDNGIITEEEERQNEPLDQVARMERIINRTEALYE